MGLRNCQDDSLPNGGHCALCGRYFDINEVQVGVYTDYYLSRGTACPCPTCFGHQLHRVQDPSLQDVMELLKFCDSRPSRMFDRASIWDTAVRRRDRRRPPD